MKRLLIILFVLFTASGCVRSVDGYTSNPAIASALSQYSKQKIAVARFDDFLMEGMVNQCRGYTLITTTHQKSLNQYIHDAFITELELANAYSPDSPIVIKGTINDISLHTLNGGKWIIKMTLSSNNGRSFSVTETYRFTSNIVGESACQAAADTFTYAVQNVIHKLVTSPNFRLLIEPSTYPKPVEKPQQEKLSDKDQTQKIRSQTAIRTQ